MNTIDVFTVTAKKLRDGLYRIQFPTYYNLKNVIEVGLWHDKQNVFDHVVKVYENLEKEFLDNSNKIAGYLSQSIGNKNRKDILKNATLLHDIAKNETLIVSKNGANCPGHEHIAVGTVKKNYKELFSLDSHALSYIEKNNITSL